VCGRFGVVGGVRKNIEIRNKVYTHKLFREIISLETKDAQRVFDVNQKTVIWCRDNGECKLCGCEVGFKDMHTDHITSHSKGGKITIENGQTLCAGCNLKKVINKEIPKILKKIDLKKGGHYITQTANNFLKFFITQFKKPLPLLDLILYPSDIHPLGAL
jgi:hypothetical protein